jgi:hypothetical protein
MTNNEAISRIKFLLDVGGSDGFTSSDGEALNTAINALYECKKPKTNGDRIRQMTDEELAEFLNVYAGCRLCDGYKRGICNSECIKGFLAWLRKEVDEDAGSKTD